ncbi:hypothetical protein [uncultured Cytophaga sp.]|uniref:hypothetical protein n=1 Tax=uncultured Cytophaga sp. TaxID=160238 RepID=UPI0026091EFE|nr:hypothetical protein [uncultured Cytophaga sp.]
MENIKILFWVVAIGFYIYTQLKDSFKKNKNANPAPAPAYNSESNRPKAYSKPITKLPTIPVSSYTAPTSSYQSTTKKASKRYQSKYNKAEEMRQLLEELDGTKPKEIVREAFYKNTDNDIDPSKSLFKEKKSKEIEDEHLTPYSLTNKKKHPLLQFLSNKNNLRNGFITGEIMKRPL